MGKVIKFILAAILFLFALGMVMGLIEQFGGILIVVVVIGVVLVVIGKASSKSSQPTPEAKQEPPKPAPEPAKKTEKDEIEKLHVDMED